MSQPSVTTATAPGSATAVKDVLMQRIGFYPTHPVAWMYAARGLYKLGDYQLCIEALSHCLRNPKTLKEAQHLLGFSLMHMNQPEAAAAAFGKSVKMGNETDWQPLIELHLEHPNLGQR